MSHSTPRAHRPRHGQPPRPPRLALKASPCVARHSWQCQPRVLGFRIQPGLRGQALWLITRLQIFSASLSLACRPADNGHQLEREMVASEALLALADGVPVDAQVG